MPSSACKKKTRASDCRSRSRRCAARPVRLRPPRRRGPHFFFKDTATTEIYTFPYTTLFRSGDKGLAAGGQTLYRDGIPASNIPSCVACRSEEHTSELQSHSDIVCRLLLE